MKKFLSVLFALVLVVSLSLVTAVPVAASPATLNVVPFELQTTGGGIAAWSTSANHTGSWGVNIGTDTDGTDYGRVAFAWNQNLSTITDMSYWYNLQAGNGSPNWDSGPYMNIEIDTTGDGNTDAWVLHKMFFLSPGTGTWLQWKLSDDPIDSQYMEHNSTDMWHVWDGSAMTDYALWSDVLAVHGSDTAIKIKIAVGDWASDIETRHYVDDIQINGVTYCGKIQDAIDSASASDTIVVTEGTYAEDLVIPVGKDNLELKPASGAAVKIKGVDTLAWANWPLPDPNIDILASGVKIHGFTIESPDVPTTDYSSGIVLDGTNNEIYDNEFVSTGTGGAGCVAIQTYRDNVLGYNSDISGLDIHDNQFSGTLTGGWVGVFVNHTLTGTGTVTVQDNDFSGTPYQGVVTERDNTVISGNSIITDMSATGYGVIVMDWDARAQDNVQVTGNTIKGASGSAEGIRIGHSGGGQTLTNITVAGNTVQDNDTGIKVRSSADGVVVNFNNINGNTTYGVQNTDTTNTLDATNNWWGDDSGPSTSPGTGDKVSADVDYDPWLGAPVVVPGGVHHETLGAGTDIVVNASAEADTIVTLTTTGDTEIYIARYASQPFPDEPFPDEALGKYIDIYVSNPENVVWPIYVEVSYTHAEVAAAGIDEGTLGLYYYEVPDTFHRCSDTGVDTVGNIIWANVIEEECTLGAPFGGGGYPPPPPPPPPLVVGGEVYPINKVSVLAPWVGLILILAIGGGALVLRRRRAD